MKTHIKKIKKHESPQQPPLNSRALGRYIKSAAASMWSREKSKKAIFSFFISPQRARFKGWLLWRLMFFLKNNISFHNNNPLIPIHWRDIKNELNPLITLSNHDIVCQMSTRRPSVTMVPSMYVHSMDLICHHEVLGVVHSLKKTAHM